MNAQSQNKTLVVYFSHSGNTKVVANYIQELTGADIIRIEPVDKYPTDYNTVCDQAKKEISQHYYPELKETIENIDNYDTIFIGTPNWWSTMAPPVATFLTSYDFKGKTIIPFCTHGGGGVGQIFADIAKLCPDAQVIEGFSVNGYSVNECKSKVEKWIDAIKQLKK